MTPNDPSPVRPATSGPTLLLSAFGIHIGGGLVLLRALLRAGRGAWKQAAVDARLDPVVTEGIPHVAVRRSLLGRVRAVHSLARGASAGDVLFCFNGLPPLRAPARGVRVVCFVQAPHFVGAHRGIRYAPLTRLRIAIERFWFARGVRHCDALWVQTPTMEAALRRRFPAARIEVVPFVDDELFEALARTPLSANPPYTGGVATFFYPAELVGHKNHATLVQAWSLLQDRGCTARLQLTLRPEEEELLARECPQLRSLAAVTNLGRLTRAQVLDTMRGSSALLFASRAETFGLPLLEATAHQVPVLAAERDFVRDVCAPAQTFDPESARSIADAVQRFLQQGQAGGIQVESAASVVRRLLAA